MPPSRDRLGEAIGKIIFLKLSKEDISVLLKDAGASPDWKTVSHYTRQALTSVDAARSIATLFVHEVTVINELLEPQVFIGGMQPCMADLVCCIALGPVMLAFPDDHKWALCNTSRWFDHMQHLLISLSPPSTLTREVVPFNYNTPSPPPTVASLPVLVGSPGGGGVAVPTSAASSAEALAPAPAKGAKAAGGGGGAAPSDAPSTEKKAKKEKDSSAADEDEEEERLMQELAEYEAEAKAEGASVGAALAGDAIDVVATSRDDVQGEDAAKDAP
mmetsp:Transcript_36681/g.96853  ORF Transcript_36681/g.96853 Transcript_36681/m.96853 type:complete len:274 (-) Transcript_36681:434-1255(-)